jgi:hypothetical protein
MLNSICLDAGSAICSARTRDSSARSRQCLGSSLIAFPDPQPTCRHGSPMTIAARLQAPCAGRQNRPAHPGPRRPAAPSKQKPRQHDSFKFLLGAHDAIAGLAETAQRILGHPRLVSRPECEIELCGSLSACPKGPLNRDTLGCYAYLTIRLCVSHALSVGKVLRIGQSWS